jgi:transcription termination factor Rho
MYDISQLTEMLLPELKEIAEKVLIPKAKVAKSKKPELIELILKKQDMQEKESKEEVVTKTETTEENPAKEKKERTRIPRKVAEKVVPVKKSKENPFSDRNALHEEFKKEDIEIGLVNTDISLPKFLSTMEIEKELTKIGESD